MFEKLQKSWQMRVDKRKKYGIMIVLKGVNGEGGQKMGEEEGITT